MRNRETAGLVLCLVCSRTGRSQRRREERRGALDGPAVKGETATASSGRGGRQAKSKAKQQEEEEDGEEGEEEDDDDGSVNRREMQGTASPLVSFLFSSSSPDFKEATGTAVLGLF